MAISDAMGEKLARLAMGDLPVDEEVAVYEVIAIDAEAALAYAELSEMIALDDEDEPLTAEQEQAMKAACARIEANLKRFIAKGR